MGGVKKTEKGVILRVIPYREIDCIVKLFSEENGKLTGFAFGGLKSKKRFVGSLEKFNLVVFTYTRYPGYIVLEEASLKRRFSQLYKSSKKLGMAVNCLRFVESVHRGPPDSKRVFELLVEFLTLLEEVSVVPFYFLLFFKAKLCGEYGYFPSLDMCFDCSKSLNGEGGVFFFHERKMRCKRCSYNRRGGFFLNTESVKSIKQVFRESPFNWRKINFSAVDKTKILGFLDKFVHINLGDFLKDSPGS